MQNAECANPSTDADWLNENFAFQSMLQKLGQWLMEVACLLQAPHALRSLTFPETKKIDIHSGLLHEHETHKSGSDDTSSMKLNPSDEQTSQQQLSKSLILATLHESSTLKTQSPSEQELTVINIKVTESSRNDSQNKINIPRKIEVGSHSNESDKKTASEFSFKTFPTVKERQKSPGMKKSHWSAGSAIASSEELSLSVGSLDSVFSVPESSDTANIQASSLSDDNRASGKMGAVLMGQKDAED
ncbi:Protein of unknown function, partial [Gryllus bimaculatus]